MAMDYETFKSQNMSFEDMKNIPSDERRELIRRLIEEKDSAVSAVLYDARHNRSVSIFDLADDMGLDGCADFINDLIDKSAGEARGITGDEFRKMVENVKNGTATESEQHLVKMIMEANRNSREEEFHAHFLDMLSGFIKFSKDEMDYIPTISDIAGCVGMFCTWAMTVSDENQGLSKYSLGNADAVSEIGIQIGDDIYDTWKATLTEELDPSLVLTGLMYLTTRVAREAGYKFQNIEQLRDIFEVDCGCDCDTCECCEECHGNEDGSNTEPVSEATENEESLEE